MEGKQSNELPIVVSFEGVIGSGKTSSIAQIIPKLEKRGFRIKVIEEPVDQWKREGMLQEFYSDMKRNSFRFQLYVSRTRMEKIKREYDAACRERNVDIIILERCSHTDLFFASAAYEIGNMTKGEFEEYLNIWSLWYNLYPALRVNLYVFVKCDIGESIVRTKSRDRCSSEVSSVTESYQSILLRKHEEFFQMPNYFGKPVNAVVLDNNSEHIAANIDSFFEGFEKLLSGLQRRDTLMVQSLMIQTAAN